MVEFTHDQVNLDAAANHVALFILRHPDVVDKTIIQWMSEHQAEELRDFTNAFKLLVENRDELNDYYMKMLNSIELYNTRQNL